MCAVLIVLIMAVSGARGEALAALEALLPSYLLGNVEDLVRAASAACELVPLELFAAREGSAPPPPLQVVEFGRSGARAFSAARPPRLVRPPRGAALPLYVPGWWNSPTDAAARGLVSALLQHHPTVLVLDTRRAFGRGYLSAATRVDAVSRLLYSFIENLNEGGISPASLHLIGFSLGAHVAGAAGKLVQKGMRAKVGRITALDPAKPCFSRAERRLQRTDAQFVHVIHSSAGVLGLAEPLGHADVYVNGVAGAQPECRRRSVSLECDHNQAWRVFADWARRAPPAAAARRCASWRELRQARCSGQRALVGYGCSSKLRGMYLYKTES